jgi:actin-like ATPase involved in cell morphogenesis
MAYSLGIDLGTTLSAAATARDGRIEIIQLGETATTMPSIVVVRADVEVLVGDAAERGSFNEPARTARGFKRRLGDPDPIVLGGTPYGVESLLAHLLRAIVARVSDAVGGPPDAIVLTHPASYGPDKIAVLEGAVRQAGLDTVSFLTEPEAAAIHEDQRESLPVGAVVAVYDFGGGTFDAAILRKTESGFEGLGTSEELERLGGIDFDEAFSSSVVGFVTANGITVDPDETATAAALARLRDEGRRAKEALSSEPETIVHVDLPGFQAELPLTREDFEDLVRPRIAETIGVLARVTESAGLTFNELDRILLIGGSSQIPLVAEMVGEATGRPITVDADSKDSIALGAAFVAEQRRLAASSDAAAAAAAAGVAGTGSILGMEAAAAIDAAVGDSPATEAPAVVAAPPTEVVPVADAGVAAASSAETVTPARAAPAAAGVRAVAGRRRTLAAAAAIGAVLLVLLVAAGASGMLSGAASSSPPASAAVVSTAPAVVASVTPSASATSAPTTTPLPSASAIPSASSTPAGRQARITGIAITDGRYVVQYETFGYTPALPGTHMHFFFNTVSVADAGVPGAGPWFLYAGPAPFTGYKVSDKPADATQMCILVANPDHSVIPDTGNCVPLP